MLLSSPTVSAATILAAAVVSSPNFIMSPDVFRGGQPRAKPAGRNTKRCTAAEALAWPSSASHRTAAGLIPSFPARQSAIRFRANGSAATTMRDTRTERGMS